ncbi:hypothetical protein SDC9_181099 [bioreactor metagenome]|uniref:Uncharacterized protein n=1 Tax=bioreactor metagenome TaxID=1076179 RepID=A0A645H4J7_9ZZZZ
MVGRDHDHHAQGGEQHEHVELATPQGAAGLDVAAGIEQHHDHGQVQHQLEQAAHQVTDEGAGECVGDFAVGGEEGQQRRRQDEDHAQAIDRDMVGQRREALGQLQGRQGRIKMNDGNDGKQQFAQRERLAEHDGGRPLLEGEDQRRTEQQRQHQA